MPCLVGENFGRSVRVRLEAIRSQRSLPISMPAVLRHSSSLCLAPASDNTLSTHRYPRPITCPADRGFYKISLLFHRNGVKVFFRIHHF
ncbi:hypothetical protein BD410DRAFT_501039 [Rickenella mellea]|uniref:Uncharacterized protein n=1 Tax=Rickenella mellea TaxID=50990 RepID=A0A4Y7PTN5_9AGAM|nr:hypothetical protein BD410DRAFT_501039 [Rickenella mellea]